MNQCPHGCGFLDFDSIATGPSGWCRWSRCRLCGLYVGQHESGLILTQTAQPVEGIFTERPRRGR